MSVILEKQLNNKVLQLRAEYYIELVISLEPEDSQKRIIKKLKKHFSDEEKKNSFFDEREIGKSLIENAVNIKDLVASLSNIISPQNQIGKALMKLLSI